MSLCLTLGPPKFRKERLIMKKVIATLLTLSVVLALASCGEDPVDNTSSGGTSSVTSIAQVSSQTPSIPSVEVSIPSIEIPVEPEAPVNLALDGTPFDCGAAVYGETNTSDLINDGVENTGWQPANWAEDDYVGITLAETAEVGSLIIEWESSTYVDTFENGGYELYYLTPGTEDEWVKIENCEVGRDEGVDGDNFIADTVVLEEAVSVDAIKIVLKAGGITDHKYAPKVWELEIYAPEAEEEGETTESTESAEAESTETESTEAAE